MNEVEFSIGDVVQHKCGHVGIVIGYYAFIKDNPKSGLSVVKKCGFTFGCNIKEFTLLSKSVLTQEPKEEVVEERKRVRKPVHPGEIIRVDYFYNSGKSLEDFSKSIGIKQKRLIKIMECDKNLKLKESHKLAEAFDTTVEFWEGLQKEYSSHKETEYLLSSPNNAKHLTESINQLKKGELVEQRTS